MDERLRTLQAMQRRELVALCQLYEPPVPYKRSWKSKQIAKAVREREIYEENRQQVEQGPEKPTETQGQRPRNPAFEQAVGGQLSPEPVAETRGGARPGAGRPKGMTDVKAAVKNLPQQPNQTILMGVKTLFSLLARQVRVPEVELSEDEAEQLALPVTQLQEFYLPDGIPEIAWVWASAGFTFYQIAESRIKIINAARKAKQDEKAGHKNNSGQDGQRQDNQSPEPDSPK